MANVDAQFGQEGQRRLKAATVFISRIGGVGGTVAMQLAAAGIGRLILADAGTLRLDDLNRQLLMTTEGVGKPRIDSAVRRLREWNPHVAVEAMARTSTQATWRGWWARPTWWSALRRSLRSGCK